MQVSYWTLLKWSCLALCIGSIVAAGMLMWLNDEAIVADSPQAGEEGEKPQANVEKPLIVERKGERIIWRLQAESAVQEEQGMHLVDPRLELFTDQGEAVPIRGDEAWFEPAARNIRFKSHVQVLYRGWTLKSGELQYDSGRDEVLVPGAFNLSKPGSSLKGDGMRIDRKSERVTVERNVELEDHLYIRSGKDLGESVRITSGSMLVDHRKQRAEFARAVHLVRDDFTLDGDRLIVLYRQQGGGEIEQAEAYGHVVMRQGEKQGVSESAVYNQERNELLMVGNAEVSDASGSVKGERLIHHLDTKLTTVEKGASEKRATMFIEEENTKP